MLMKVIALACIVAATAVTTDAGARASRAGSDSRTGTIAFLRFSPSAWSGGTLQTSLFRIRADGSGLRRLTPLSSHVFSYQWSPDASKIAYTDDRGSLWIVRSNGTGLRLLVPSRRMRSWSVSWSPDGRAIAVVAQDDPLRLHSPTGLYVVAIDGRERRLPVRDAGFSAAWSPRGDEIAYGSGSGRVELIRPDGTGSRVVHYGGGGLEWSADGTLIGVDTAVHLRQGCLACVHRYAGIAVLGAGGSNFHVVTTHAYNEYGFAWSPTGAEILYGRANRHGIYVIDADGRHDHRITRDSPIGSIWGALAWAPDGRSIAYESDRAGSGDIYVIGADGRDRVRLTSSDDIDVAPSWAPRPRR